MQWFKHDTDASLDAKLQELLLDYGAKGYGLYWYCIEMIASRVSAENVTFELEHDIRLIARNLNLSLEETKNIMQKMVTLGLLGISGNTFNCISLAKRIDQSMTSNAKFRKIIKNIRDNHDEISKNHDTVMTEDNNIMISHDSVMNRIEEKRREEKEQDGVRKISPHEIIFLYKKEVSDINAKVRETKSINELALNHKGMYEKIMIGIVNYAKTVKDSDEQFITNLQDFLINKTYLDYQEEKKEATSSKIEGLYYHG